MSCRVTVVFHSVTGSIRQLASWVAQGAEEGGAEVRLRQVFGYDAPSPEALPTRQSEVPQATVSDLLWAHGIAIGCPTTFGNVSADLKQFLDDADEVAAAGFLADKVGTGFTSASSPNGGQEACLLALYHTLHRWGTVIVSTGCTHPAVRRIGGNPYGLSVTYRRGASLGEDARQAAFFLGGRLARLAGVLVAPVLVGT